MEKNVLFISLYERGDDENMITTEKMLKIHHFYKENRPRSSWRRWYRNRACSSVGKKFVHQACGHEFKSRLNWKFSNYPHHLWLLLSDYRGMVKWFGAHYNQEVRFSSTVKCKKGPQVLISLLNQWRNYYYYMGSRYKTLS